VIWFEPGEKHWHGASPTTAMTDIAIQEALDGKAVDWMQKSARSSTSAAYPKTRVALGLPGIDPDGQQISNFQSLI
jgi:hypothetical protein